MKTINDRFYWNQEHQSLLVDWTEELGVSCQQIVGAWDSGLGVKDYLFGEEDTLSLADTRLDLLSPQPHPAVASWQQTFPTGVLQALRSLQSRQIEIMLIAAGDKAAEQLLKVNANLLHIWLDYCELNTISVCQRRRAYGLGEAALMSFMGLDSSRLAIRMIRELSADALGLEHYQALRHLFTKPHILRRLVPAGRFNGKLLSALDHWPWIAGYPIQALLSEGGESLRVSLQNVLDADRAELGMEAIEQLRQCTSHSHVRRVESSWQGRVNLHKVLATLDATPILNRAKVKTRLPILHLPVSQVTQSMGSA
jgi:hypothetical protein